MSKTFRLLSLISIFVVSFAGCSDEMNSGGSSKTSATLSRPFTLQVQNPAGDAPLQQMPLKDTDAEIRLHATSSDTGYQEFQKLELKVNDDVVRTGD